ncbi:ABC transporter substrate-binding protein [Hafnia psychrotolerans]|uniref:Iron-hydroxamate transporter substrate-binding subunit n=1 Tax=Hafnia psychrotolerans TaxID=1477018 RepID=A0ABQ1G220_9GAMM|nr:ABC transporter substrate-binding protein [Hafnia psychrotolerans]GGA35317.1 iron-hydroxamate transporter substrate-binding subunit [Hafnia psychrotolerans]
MLTRRNLLLAGFTLFPAAYALASGYSPPLRIVSLDLAITESLLGLGIAPIAVANKRWYLNFIGHPQLPDTVQEAGLPGEPNLELLEALRPDVILCSRAQAQVNSRLQQIAPVATMDIFKPDSSPWLAAQQMITQLGNYASVTRAAQKLNAEASEQLASTGVALEKYQQRPIFLARINDDGRHLLLFGRKGMYDDLLKRMGFRNACEGKTNAWGGAVVGLDYLLRQPDARLIFFSNQQERRNVNELLSSPLWQAIPLIREGRYSSMSRLYPSGGLLSAMHFLSEFERSMKEQNV